MTTSTTREIDYSTFPESDGEPMAETLANMFQMIDLQWALQTLLISQGRGDQVAVGGNQLMYYNPHNGREHVSPDVYVVFDYPPPAPPKWQTWVEGKFPDIVFEISSQSTTREDVGTGVEDKPALYRRLGVQEYYIYDPQGDLQTSLRGYGWVDGQWTERALLPSGGIWSSLLGAELRSLDRAVSMRRPAGRWLRILDPRTGEPFGIAEEDVQAAEEHVRQVEQARQAAEEHARQEEQARQAAEQRVARAEAALQALLAASSRRDPPDGSGA